MSDFKVGDIVHRTKHVGAGSVGHGVELGGHYEVTKVGGSGQIFLKESDVWWDGTRFTKSDRASTPPNTFSVQYGGSHYKKLAIQPVEYIMANSIPYMEGNVVKYVTRWRDKGGIQDLNKAKHYIEMLIENEEKNNVA